MFLTDDEANLNNRDAQRCPVAKRELIPWPRFTPLGVENEKKALKMYIVGVWGLKYIDSV